jgi:hypothetical protein
MSHHEAAGCPFYGYAFAHATADEERRFFGAALIASGGNRCALVTNAHSPCAMETAGTDPSWQHCGRNPSAEAAGERPSLTQIAAYLPRPSQPWPATRRAPRPAAPSVTSGSRRTERWS